MTGRRSPTRSGMALSTVSGILTRLRDGEARPPGLEPACQRYERSRAGELVHVDVKKLGPIVGGAGWRVRGGAQHYNPNFHRHGGQRRGTVGWEYVHIAIDDYSRLAYAEVLARREGTDRGRLPRRALAFFARYGVMVERLPTDNGAAYRSTLHALACRTLGIRHLRTPALPAADGRQSRALHPHAARRLGLRRDLPLKR